MQDLTTLHHAYWDADEAARRPDSTEEERRARDEAERVWQAARAADWDRRNKRHA